MILLRGIISLDAMEEHRGRKVLRVDWTIKSSYKYAASGSCDRSERVCTKAQVPHLATIRRAINCIPTFDMTQGSVIESIRHEKSALS